VHEEQCGGGDAEEAQTLQEGVILGRPGGLVSGQNAPAHSGRGYVIRGDKRCQKPGFGPSDYNRYHAHRKQDYGKPL
jgi:hypothetical protein